MRTCNFMSSAYLHGYVKQTVTLAVHLILIEGEVKLTMFLKSQNHRPAF